MKETPLRAILGQLGIKVEHTRTSGDGRPLLEAKCPFAKFYHKSGTDSRPSFAAFVNDEGISGYVCKGCHQQGRIETLVTSLASLRKKPYGRILTEAILAESDVSLPEWDEQGGIYEEQYPEPVSYELYTEAYLPASQYPEAMEYLAGRGISPETALALELAYDDDKRRILFPVFDLQGDFFGYSGRLIYEADNQVLNPKVRDYLGLKKKWMILGQHLWEKGKPVLLVEGLFGYAHLHEIGADELFNIGAIMGSEFTKQKAEAVIGFDEAVYLLFDNDAGGDLGLFGRAEDKHSDKGAIRKLINHVPVFVPSWGLFDPLESSEDGDIDKDDPDQLTLEEVSRIIPATPLFTKGDL